MEVPDGAPDGEPTDTLVLDVRGSRNRFNAKSDLVFLELVKQYNPYMAESETTAWRSITKGLDESQLFKNPTKVRTAKDHLALLLTAFKKKDLRSKSRSGVEEQYTKMANLLTEIAEMIKSGEQAGQEKKRVAEETQQERGQAAKFLKTVGESGRKLPNTEEAHYQLAAGHSSGADPEKEEWLRLNGGDEEDWEHELRHRAVIELLEKNKSRPAKSAGQKPSPKKSPKKFSGGNKIRTARSAAAKDKNADSDEKWLEYFRISDEKRLEFEKAKAAEENAAKQKQAEDAKEVRLKELEVEKLRLELELKKVEAQKISNTFGL